MKSKPKEEFPLKGIIKSPCCGRNLTAGWSTGKLKKYMYYRFLDHSNTNIYGIELHEKFEELLRHLSFTSEFITEVVQLVSRKVKEILKSNENRLKELRQQLHGIEVMIVNVDQKLFSAVINDDTYKRNMQKFKGEQGKLNDEIENLNNLADNIQQDLLVLPYMLNLHQVYIDAPLR